MGSWRLALPLVVQPLTRNGEGGGVTHYLRFSTNSAFLLLRVSSSAASCLLVYFSPCDCRRLCGSAATWHQSLSSWPHSRLCLVLHSLTEHPLLPLNLLPLSVSPSLSLTLSVGLCVSFFSHFTHTHMHTLFFVFLSHQTSYKHIPHLNPTLICL